MEAKDRIIVALDVSNIERAATLVQELIPYVGGFKLGLEFITGTLAKLASTGLWEAFHNLAVFRNLICVAKEKLFWDGKWADIPNTIAGAAQGIQPLSPMFINVHASSGMEAIKAAVANRGHSLVLGVTVLTSIKEEECISIFGDSPWKKVFQFAEMLVEAGADGIICSPQELNVLNTFAELHRLLRVVPGVRPSWAELGDQKRVMTPAEAIDAGADWLVIGRPITKPPAEIGLPVDAAKKIAEEIASVL